MRKPCEASVLSRVAMGYIASIKMALLILIILNSMMMVVGVLLFLLDAQSWLGMPLGALLVVVGVAFLYMGWKGSKETRLGLLVTCGAAVFALYVGELVLMNLPKPESPAVGFSSSHDHRSKKEVVRDLQNKGNATVVPMVYPSFAIHFPGFIPEKFENVFGQTFLPLGGISNSTTVLCNEGGAWAIYESDEHGFNNPQGTWSQPIEIAVVGDSFSHGNCVQAEEGWVGKLRSSFKGILNLGVGGNGPLFALATLREFLPAVQPPIVLWQYFEGHDTRVPGEKTLPLLLRYLDDSQFGQSISEKQSDVDHMLKEIVGRALDEPEAVVVPKKFSIRNFIVLSQMRNYLGLVKKAPLPPLDDVTSILGAAKKTVDLWGGKLYFVYLPSWYGLTTEETPTHYASHTRVIQTAQELGLDIIDLDPIFRNHPDPLSLFPYRGNFHYNPAGYSVVAQTVHESLQRTTVK